MKNGVSALSSLSMIVRIVLGIFIFACAWTTIIQLLAIVAPDFVVTNPEIIGLATAGAVGLQVLTFFASIVMIPIWVYRAHANLADANMTGLNFSPAWATASFFVPFANMYIPFTSTRELHNRSHGESDWHAKADVGDVTSWNACNWGAFVVFIVLVGYYAVDSVPGLFIVMPNWAWLGLTIMLYALIAGSAWFLFQIVKKITEAQEQGLHLSQSDVFA